MGEKNKNNSIQNKIQDFKNIIFSKTKIPYKPTSRAELRGS
jgi:hypothetical protein